MFTGLTVAACLLLAGDPAPALETTPMGAARFEIPLSVLPSRRPDIQELRVYVSRDGKNWERHQAVPIPADERVAPKTIFEAKEDGFYYFTLGTVSKTNHMEDPPRPGDGPIAMKILVDTVRPAITLNAERVGDKIQAKWSIVEEHPMKASFRLEFQDPANSQWYVVPEAIPGPEGTALFAAPSSAACRVRLTLKDVADNVGKAEVSVPAATSAVVNNTTAWPSDSGSTQTIKPITPVTTEYSPPPISPVRSQETNPTPLMTEQRTVASSSMNVPPPQYPPSTGSPYVPQVKLVSQPQVKIEFGVEHLGPSGVGKVDVYLTTNDGQTWEHTATETPIIGPNNEYGQQGGRDSVMVKIPRQEIVYGIFLVVKNGAGVGGPPPRNGQDRPMMRVEVDTRLPDILLYAPKPDPAREGVILLSWKAVDRNLDDYPVTIEYREDPNGPWRLVSNTPSLPNTGALDAYSTGSFAWTVPNIATGLVYLKLTVRDKAGNVSEATTPKPVLIDLSKPVPTNLTVNGGT